MNLVSKSVTLITLGAIKARNAKSVSLGPVASQVTELIND